MKKRYFATPRSISAMKVEARALREEQPNLTQTKALEVVSTRAGFSNWTHASRQLPDVMKAVTLHVSWRDDGEKTWGTESLSYPMPWSAAEIVAMKLKAARIAGFGVSSLEANSLVHSGMASSQYMARYWAVQALRELMFMEATGLKPRHHTVRAYPHHLREWHGNKYFEPTVVPGADHASLWQDPGSKAILILDEPYLEGQAHPRAKDRDAWCAQFGYEQLLSSWGGTYLPPKSSLFMFTHAQKGVDLVAIEEKLKGLPDDFSAEEWKGKSEEHQLLKRG